MNAFHTIRAEMHEAAASVTHPHGQDGAAPMIKAPTRSRSQNAPGDDQPDTHIEPWMAQAFAGLVRAVETDEPFVLLSCFMNGRPAAVIAYIRDEGRRKYVMPLFMAVQPGMHFTPHEEDEPD
jgi:hypothetical protein